MRRRALTLLLVPALLTGCTRTTAPKARLAGEIFAISGVVGLIGGALITPYTGHTKEIMAGFSIMSAVGIGLFAAGELTDPTPGPRPETEREKHLRWAKILTQRAGGAAREGNCRRVRRLEKRVHVYNREIHDFVFMRDPEILRCLEAPPPPPAIEGDVPAIPKGLDPGPVAPSSDPAP
ncbi:MAG: hypothetical protein H0T46_35040 [Deltaproteobacteria bacterium]|nr:hypothetical protein [Deltaproteobacteria bacterium]